MIHLPTQPHALQSNDGRLQNKYNSFLWDSPESEFEMKSTVISLIGKHSIYQRPRNIFSNIHSKLPSRSFCADGHVLHTAALSHMGATEYLWLVSSWNVAGLTEEKHSKRNLI